MCKTHRLAHQFDLKILNRLRGAEVLDVPEHGELEDGVYLTEKEGKKFILKTGNFNPQETEDNQELARLGFKVPVIISSEPEEYILYEYVEAPLLSETEFWSDENMQRVFDLHRKIASGLKDRPITDEHVSKAVGWIESKLLGEWLDGIVGPVYSEDEASRVREVAESTREIWGVKEGLAWVYGDNNAEHYVDLKDDLLVLDADISIRPKHYMDMRYLAWTILKMPKEKLSVEWVKDWIQKLEIGKSGLITFLLSLIGILWDIHGNPKHKGQNVEKTGVIKEIVDYVIDSISKAEERNN